MLAVIAWRNLWRNRRRTLSAIAAVAGGVAAMVIVSALMNAMSDRMVEAMTGSFMGHIQIHREGYRSKRSPIMVITDADRVLEAVRSTDGVEAAAGRIYGSAHASLVRGEDSAIRSGRALLGRMSMPCLSAQAYSTCARLTSLPSQQAASFSTNHRDFVKNHTRQ